MERDKNQGFKRRQHHAARPLTIRTIAEMRPGEMLADGAIRPGAGTLKVRRRATTRGAVTEFLFEFKRAGKTTRMTIGRFSVGEAPGMLTLPQAHSKARELQAIVRAGSNPLAQREIEREAARVQEAAALAESAPLPRKRSVRYWALTRIP